jgi:succinyl-CoA synthetase beta subunit
MKLLEHEGKKLLAQRGIPIPAGALWPAFPPAGTGWAVKAQVLAGGRGKRGGIKFAVTRAEMETYANAMAAAKIGDEPVHAVLIEARLDIAQELYLAFLVDRDRGRVAGIASASGGVDIESVPPEKIARVEIDPLIGIAGFQTRALARALGLAPEIAPKFEAIARQLHDALVGEDAELAEINPLVVTRGGELIAADAKILLDDDAVGRHKTRGAPVAWTADGDFMRRCRELDAIGVDNRLRNPPARRPRPRPPTGSDRKSPW